MSVSNNVFSKKIATKLSLIIVLVIVAVICALVSIVVLQASSSLRSDAISIMQSSTDNIAKTVQVELDRAIAVASSTHKALQREFTLDDKGMSTIQSILIAPAESVNLIVLSALYLSEDLGISQYQVKDDDGTTSTLIAYSDTNYRNQPTLVSDVQGLLDNGIVNVKESLRTGEPRIGKSANISGDGIKGITVAFPIERDGKTIGVVFFRISVDFIQEVVRNASDGLPFENSAHIADLDRVFLASTSQNIRDRTFEEAFGSVPGVIGILNRVLEQDSVNSEFVNSKGLVSILNSATLTINPFGAKWKIIVASPLSVIMKDLYSLVDKILLATVAAILLSIVFFVLIIKSSIVNRIQRIRDVLMQTFALINFESDQTPVLLPADSKDELGDIAEMINRAITQTQNTLSVDSLAVQRAIDVAKSVEQGNLSARIEVNASNPQLLQLKNVLNQMLETLEKKIGADMNIIQGIFKRFYQLDFTQSIQDARGDIEIVINQIGVEIRRMLNTSLSFVKNLNNESENLNQTITELKNLSLSQADSIQQTAASVEQINVSMKIATDNTQRVIEQSKKIMGVTEIIRDIADQINLLALNASIEAARAGESGRGFAVVADEVRSLANRTQTSLASIDENTDALIKGIDSMSNSISEQSHAIELITQAMSKLEQITQSNNDCASRASTISSNVSQIANDILGDANLKKF